MTEIKKNNFFKYLLNGNEDWGINLITTGYHNALKNEKYPPPGHPKTHEFEWKNGRKLDGYYIIYIPTGTGCLELKDSITTINSGDSIITYKNEWHRYKPKDNTGWEEYWVGFKGSYIEKYITENLFPQKTSHVKKVGYQTEIFMLFNQLIEFSKKNPPIYHKLQLGCLIQIIAYFTNDIEEKSHTNRNSYLVEKTIAYIRQNLSNDIDFTELAQSFNLSYSRYRFIFKNMTGLAPNQFLINERLQCAMRMLKNTEMNINEIAYKSGFQSPQYFSRLFHKKTGGKPSNERTRN